MKVASLITAQAEYKRLDSIRQDLLRQIEMLKSDSNPMGNQSTRLYLEGTFPFQTMAMSGSVPFGYLTSALMYRIHFKNNLLELLSNEVKEIEAELAALEIN